MENEPENPTPNPPSDGGNTAQPGHLYVVATPIGNLNDISHRAASILATADIVACEDTRTTGVLLSRLDLRKTTVAYHEHNEKEKAPQIADQIASGKSVALVSDAGTPAISDPGFRLVRECRSRNLPVVPIPGPSAFTAVLSASGLPTNGFLFAGFLAPKSAARRRFLEEHRDFPYTICLYESCHRILKMMNDLQETLGPDRVICVAKEITKRHETFLTGKTSDVAAALQNRSLKGEFVLLIAPSTYTL